MPRQSNFSFGFFDWLAEHRLEEISDQVTDFDEDSLIEFRNRLRNQHKCRASFINNVRAALIAFCFWLHKNRSLGQNPSLVIESVAQGEPIRCVATNAGSFVLRSAAALIFWGPPRLIARAVLSFCVHGGLRAGSVQ